MIANVIIGLIIAAAVILAVDFTNTIFSDHTD